MQPEQILDTLKETLLASLSRADPVVFAGDRRTVDYLRAFFSSGPVRADHQYLALDDEPAAQRAAIVAARRLVISSIRNEAALFDEAVRLVSTSGRQTRVLRLFADVFVNLACGEDPLGRCEERPVPPSVAYAIVGTPRCGSELLCNALTSTGRAGFPEEHLRLESQLLTRHCRFDCRRYFRNLLSRRRTGNGVFGTKIISHFLMEHLKCVPALKRDLTSLRYIHMVRRDRIGQAISAMLAAKTGVWHIRNEQAQAAYRESVNGVAIANADLRTVQRLSDGFERHERYLARFFRRNRITPLTVAYEDLVERPAEQLRAIGSFLDLAIESTDVAVTLRPTRSTLSETVRAKYAVSTYNRRSPRLALVESLRAVLRRK